MMIEEKAVQLYCDMLRKIEMIPMSFGNIVMCDKNRASVQAMQT